VNLRNIVKGELVVTVIGFSRIGKFHAFALRGVLIMYGHANERVYDRFTAQCSRMD